MAATITVDTAQARSGAAKTLDSTHRYLDNLTKLLQSVEQFNNATESTTVHSYAASAATVGTEAGQNVEKTVRSYAEAMRDIIDRFNQDQSTVGAKIDPTVKPFQAVTITAKESANVKWTDAQFEAMLSEIQSRQRDMDSAFEEATSSIKGSAAYFVGKAGEEVRSAWQSKIVPIQAQLDGYIKEVCDKGREAQASVKAADSSTIS